LPVPVAKGWPCTGGRDSRESFGGLRAEPQGSLGSGGGCRGGAHSGADGSGVRAPRELVGADVLRQQRPRDHLVDRQQPEQPGDDHRLGDGHDQRPELRGDGLHQPGPEQRHDQRDERGAGSGAGHDHADRPRFVAERRDLAGLDGGPVAGHVWLRLHVDDVEHDDDADDDDHRVRDHDHDRADDHHDDAPLRLLHDHDGSDDHDHDADDDHDRGNDHDDRVRDHDDERAHDDEHGVARLDHDRHDHDARPPGQHHAHHGQEHDDHGAAGRG